MAYTYCIDRIDAYTNSTSIHPLSLAKINNNVRKSYTNNFTCSKLHLLDNLFDSKCITLHFDCKFSDMCTNMDVYNLINSCMILPCELSNIVLCYMNDCITVNICSFYNVDRSAHVGLCVNNKEYMFRISLCNATPCCLSACYTGIHHDYMNSRINNDLFPIFETLSQHFSYGTDHDKLMKQFNSLIINNQIRDINVFLKIMSCMLIIIPYINLLKKPKLKW